MPDTSPERKVIVACPCLNEAHRAVAAIESLLCDDHADEYDILVLDGGSSDGTQDKLRKAFGDRIELIHNNQRLQSHALNMAAGIARDRGAEFLVRADLHALYPKNFVSTLCRTAHATRANSVVVSMHTQGGNRVQDAARYLFSIWLGNGGARHRVPGYRGWVDHGHHALFRVEDYLRVGGYDPEFSANEDAEFDLRLTHAGGRIFMEGDAAIDYFPRPTLQSSFRQFFRNGRYRVRTAAKHRERLSKRQLLPMAIVPVLTLAAVLGLFTPWALLVPLGYVSLVAYLAGRDARAVPAEVWTLAALLAIVNHVGFSAGALRGVLDQFQQKRQRASGLHSHNAHPGGVQK
ncbi:glycosyltransferase [Ruegeria sp.]|uniref:glycosyltransferase n=1 Tax=Ruegeria sp. TaxID=1879320 RepID=UPI003B59A9B8